MKFNLLVCDSPPVNTAMFRKFISPTGAVITFCGSSHKEIENILASKNFDAIFLFTDRRTDIYCQIIERLRGSYPEIKIFTGNVSSSLEAADRFRSAGADMCIAMPVSIMRAAAVVSVYMKFCNDGRIPLNIACFLNRCGFIAKNTGFRYLCVAVDICLREPESLEALYEKVYGRIAVIFGVRPELTERLIRSIVSAAVNDGTLSALTGKPETKITNHDLIAVLCDIYVSGRYFIL